MEFKEILDTHFHSKVLSECFTHLWYNSIDPMFVMVVEEDGEFSLHDCNPPSRATMGLSPDEDIHRLNIREKYGDEITDGLYATYRSAIDAKKPISIEQFVIVNEEELYVDTLLVPIFDESDKPILICGVSRDITKVKEAEVLAIEAKELAIDAKEKQQKYSSALEEVNNRLDEKVQQRTAELEQAKIALEDALEAKTSFVSRMSHEIRTPINAVIGLSYLALKTSLDNEQQDYLTKIQSSGDTLLGLVNDVLDFSKIEAGKLAIESTPFSLEKIVRTAIDLISINAQKNNIELIIDIAAELPTTALGDPLRLQQILVNLLSNAVKFTSDGTIIVQLTGEQSSQGLLLSCSVSDTGIGIAEDKISLLFSSFTQADNSITRQYGGTGLGLTITKQLCELMNGSIEVKSVLGKGTTFTANIPLSLPTSQPESSHFNNPHSKQMTALVIDKNQRSRALLSEHLLSFNLVPACVNNTNEAISLIQECVAKNSMYDVILIDSHMPKVDGIKTAENIQKAFKEYSIPTPILMGTTHNKSHVQPHLVSGLADLFIEKPISKSTLLDSLNKYFQIQTETSEKTPVTSAPNLAGFTILLVEDNPINMQVAKGYLAYTNVNIETADNGLTAFRYLQKHRDVDLILMDIQMPEMDGLTASSRIRLIDAYKNTPIIAMTAHTSQEDKNESLAAGMNDHIHKPILRDQLFAKISQYLLALTPKNTEVKRVKPVPKDYDIFNELEKINELNARKALINLQNNNALYLDITNKFWQKYQSISELDEAKAYFLDNAEALPDIIHTLKSNATYIGAYHLQFLCSEIEKTLQKKEFPFEDLCKAISGELSRILCQLSNILDKQDQATENGQQDLKSVLKRIFPLLKESSLKAESHLIALENLAQGSPYQDAITNIVKNVKALEFEYATQEAKQIIYQLESTQNNS
ncbi:response regulator [Marinomonas sp. C2222]|uniref:histidine kinase n=1 Tax=Marinomonas sargassi TaxID=2984494 RepID=A0ABT2YSB4_9GAMM|nr:response regulator [Marinomonas sargassi]MCV2402539.1 response regulator [Marinomonas sargassi]